MMKASNGFKPVQASAEETSSTNKIVIQQENGDVQSITDNMGSMNGYALRDYDRTESANQLRKGSKGQTDYDVTRS